MKFYHRCLEVGFIKIKIIGMLNAAEIMADIIRKGTTVMTLFAILVNLF